MIKMTVGEEIRRLRRARDRVSQELEALKDGGWQLRCRVHLAIEMSGLAASSRWARIKLSPAAQDYLSPLPPGSVIEDPEPAPTHAAVARDYFSIITAQVLSLDWLELHEQGHRRARFDGSLGVWLQP